MKMINQTIKVDDMLTDKISDFIKKNLFYPVDGDVIHMTFEEETKTISIKVTNEHKCVFCGSNDVEDILNGTGICADCIDKVSCVDEAGKSTIKN